MRNTTAPALFGRFLKFAQSGAVGTLVHYAVLAALARWLRADVVLASSAGAVAGALVNYQLNYRWTFGCTLAHRRTLPRYMLMSGASIGLNFLVMRALVALLPWHYLVLQLLATGLCLLVNYLVSSLWIFKPAPARNDSASVTP